MKIKKNIQSMYQKHVDLLLMEEKGKKHYVLIKDFKRFMYNHTLHHRKKHLCRYNLQAFSTEEILKRHIKNRLKINGKPKIIIHEKGEYVKLKNYDQKIKPPFIIYGDFKSILVLENNGKQKPEESYTNKYQKNIACSYGYKLVCVDDKFSRLFKTYLGKDADYNFVNNMIEESKYCSEVVKKYLRKELVMTSEDNEDFKNSTKCWICNKDFIDKDVKILDHCRITGQYRGSAHRDCNINVKLSHKIPVVFHNLKRYDSHLAVQELVKFSLKINVIPNGLEKYMSFAINNKLGFIGNFQFLNSLLDSLVKNLGGNDFKYLNQEFDNNVLDLVKQKGCSPQKYMNDFEKFKEEIPIELTDRKITDKEYEHVLNVWKNFEMKAMKCYHDLYLKYDVLL